MYFHLAKYYPKGPKGPKGRCTYLFLVQEAGGFVWEGSGCGAEHLPDALEAGRECWKEDYFQLVHCGFRYCLPIRDETGVNAFFWQMVKSYATPSGVYFDEDVGHQCMVKFASHEALEVWKKIS